MRLEKSLKFRAAVLKFWDKGGMDGLIFNYLGLTLFPVVEGLVGNQIPALYPQCGVSDLTGRGMRRNPPQQDAALELTKPCHCGIYNPARAEKLLRQLVPLMTYDS
jgi:hypothetical protein